MSGYALACRIGLSKAQVAKIEDGAIPAIDTVELIAAGLGYPPGWLAFGNQGSEPFKPRRPGPVVEQDNPQPDEAWQTYRARSASMGRRLAQARQRSGLSIRTLAAAAGVSHTIWGKTEAGQTLPRVDSLERMAVALGVAPAWLAYGDEPD